MIHYTCDMCKRPLDPENDLRYVVRIDIHATLDPAAWDRADEERDHLQELDEVIENLEDLEDDNISEDIVQQLRFDLCSECRKRFLKRPLGQARGERSVRFSQN